MSLTVFHVDWMALKEEYGRVGNAISVYRDSDYQPFLEPVHERYLHGDSVNENFDAADALTASLARMDAAKVAPIEEVCRTFLFGDGCTLVRDLLPSDHEQIIATFSPDTTRRLAAGFDRMDFEALSNASGALDFPSDAISDGPALLQYLLAWRELIIAAAREGKGIVICGD